MSIFISEESITDTSIEDVEDSLTDRDPLFITDYEEECDISSEESISSQSLLVQRRQSSRLINKTKIRYRESDDSDDNSDDKPAQKQKQQLNRRARYLLQKLESIKKQEKLPLNVTKKLWELHIKLIHEVPPQHKIEGSGAHAPTNKEKKQFQMYGPLRKGSYSPEEDKVIRKNWNTFCELHSWDPKIIEPFFAWRHGTKYYIGIEERQKFVQFLANGLPWRTLYSVYSRFKVLYCKKLVNARYSPKEDGVILTYMQNKNLNKRNNKYTELAKLLKRTTYSISKRYRYLKRTADNSKRELNVEWTIPLLKKYIKTLLNITLNEDISDLKFAVLPKPVWLKMEEKLRIDQNILKTFWQHQLHMQLFSTRPIYLNDIKIQLIEYMYVKGISSTREIIWPQVASHFDGATPVFLCKVFFYLVQECRNDVGNNFVDIVEYLYNTKIAAIKSAPNDKFLPRILYKDDKLVLLDEKNSNATIADIDKYE